MKSEWQRKEDLHLTIIQNFDRGKVCVFVSGFFRFSSHGSSQSAIKLSVPDCISSSCPLKLNGIYIISNLNHLIT